MGEPAACRGADNSHKHRKRPQGSQICQRKLLEGEWLEGVMDAWVTWERFSPYFFYIPACLAM